MMLTAAPALRSWRAGCFGNRSHLASSRRRRGNPSLPQAAPPPLFFGRGRAGEGASLWRPGSAGGADLLLDRLSRVGRGRAGRLGGALALGQLGEEALAGRRDLVEEVPATRLGPVEVSLEELAPIGVRLRLRPQRLGDG